MDLKKLTIREFDRAAEQFDDDSVSVYNRKEIEALCENCCMILEKYENRRWFRLHCVCRKKEV